MTDAQLLDLLREALQEVAPERLGDVPELSFGTSFDELELDSLAAMEMMGVIESRLHRLVPDDRLPAAQTLGDLAIIIREGSP